MKNILSKFIAFMAPLFLMTACLFEEEDTFDKSSALRMNEAIQADMALLTSAPNGWIVDYYPEKAYAMGGYAMHWKFLSDGTAQIACEAAVNGVPARQPASSLWDIKAEQAPILSFDTYNDVLQYFCQPSQSDIDGLAGDYEFIIRKNIDMGDNLVIAGKRNSNVLIMRPVAADVNPTQYLAQVKDFATSVVTARNFSFRLNGDSIGYARFSNASKSGLAVRTIDMEVAPPTGEEGQTANAKGTFPFTHTPNGFRINEAFFIYDSANIMHNFVWNEVERKYTCTDNTGVLIELVCLDPPPQYDYNAFIGDFTLKYGGTSLATSTTTYSTLDVTITPDVVGESYIIKGLLLPEYESQYTVRLRYNPGSGLVFDAQKLGISGTDEIWAAIGFWNGTGTVVRAMPSYSSLKSTNYTESTSGNPYGTGYSFSFSDNSNGGYPSQPSYFTYGITFRTYAPSTTGSSNGTARNIGACSDAYRCYNISFIKK